jgi:uncharacterized MAPEG superfamily protein
MLNAVPYVSLILGVVLAYWPRSVAGKAMTQMPGGYDNHLPRDQQAKLDGRGRRALAAHQNGMEAMLMFSIAVLAAAQRNVSLGVIVACCAVFLAARLAYVLAYLNDKPPLRSGMFGLGMLACFVLLGFAVFAGRPPA